MTVLALELSKPSYRGAYHYARKLAVAGDRAGADRLFCRLLWLVDAADGGLIGLSDVQLALKVADDPRLSSLTPQEITALQYAPGGWPAAEAMQVAA